MLSVGMAIFVSLILSGFWALRSVEKHFAELDLRELTVIENTVINSLERHEGNISQIRASLSGVIANHHGVFFVLSSQNGNTLFRSPQSGFLTELDTESSLSGAHHEKLRHWRLAKNSYHGLVTMIKVGKLQYKLVVAMDMSIHRQFIDIFSEKMWLIMIVIAGMTLFAVWLGMKVGLKPINALARRIKTIQANNLDEQIELGRLPAELAELGQSFNTMMMQLKESFERLTHFSADIAHELRTPLSNIINMSQVGLSKQRSNVEYRELLYSNLEEQERLAKIVDQMLWLARSDNKLIQPFARRIALKPLIEHLFEFFEAWAAEKKINFVCVGDDIELNADKELLSRAFSNLLANAVRYSPDGGEVSVRIIHNIRNIVKVVVSNQGQKIPAQHIKKIFDRFYRADTSRFRQTESSGLGLAITKAIIEAHKGTVNVESNEVQTEFIVLLPLN